ncbi:MAG: hypothetical protein A2144_00755 [Chloroflexi bacterium RBG_16_50_9]|nr:MAG: hypothetical protein A2144_00755 [Chloroflexi bacterium RBG_16_50_9]
MTTTNRKKPYSVRVTVESAAGKCPQGFKVGDSWLIEDGKTPAGMCASAYHSLFQYMRVFRFGGAHPWEKEDGVAHIACPDAVQRLVHEVRRLDGE